MLILQAILSVAALVQLWRTGMLPTLYLILLGGLLVLLWLLAGRARGQRRLQAARQLHFSESSIEEIAQQAGFCDRYHFSRAFHKEFNCGPATYRKLAIRRHDGSRR